MSEYTSKKKNAINRRVRKVQRRAKSIGILYLLGTWALLAATALLPVLTVGEVQFMATTFYQPFVNKASVVVLASAALYALLLLVLVINAFRSLGKLGGFSARNGNGYNRNMRTMSELGKVFSSSLAAIVILTLEAYLLQRPENVQFNEMSAYIVLGIGLVVHFLTGLFVGRVSRFRVNKATGVVQEEKRTCSLFVYFLRNLVQLAATGVIVLILAKNNLLYQLPSIAKGLMNGNLDFNGLVPVALQGLTVLFLMVLIKHATAATEFNLFGIEGRGMLNFRVFAFFTCLTGAGLTAWDVMGGNALNKEYAALAIVAFVAFLFDCIVKSRPKEGEAAEQDNVLPNGAYPMPYGVMPNPQAAPAPQGAQNIYVQMPPVAQQNAQPIYVPVYYPMPPVQQPVHVQVPMPVPMYQPAPPVQPIAQQPMPTAPAAPVENVRPEPAPAPDYIKPNPAPVEALQAGKTKKEVRQERREIAIRKAELKKIAKIEKKNKKADAKTAKLAAEIATRRQAAEEASAVVPALQPEEPVQAPVQEPVPVQVPTQPVLENVHYDGEVNELPPVLDPKKAWKVRCPQCGKELNVTDRSPYHRCPSCGKVFTLRKFETYAKKNVGE